MRKMPHKQDVSRFSRNRVDNPVRRVSGLEAACRGERCQRVAPLPVRLSGFSRAKLTAVPDELWLRTALGGFLRQHVDFDAASIRERPHRIHIRPYRITVVNKEQHNSRVDGIYGSAVV